MRLNAKGLPLESDFLPIVSSEEASIAYLIKQQILNDYENIPCPQCGKKVSLKQKKYSLTRFRCSNLKCGKTNGKENKNKRYSVSSIEGTLFYKSRLSINQILMFFHCCLNGYSWTQLVNCFGWSGSTVTNYKNWFL